MAAPCIMSLLSSPQAALNFLQTLRSSSRMDITCVTRFVVYCNLSSFLPPPPSLPLLPPSSPPSFLPSLLPPLPPSLPSLHPSLPHSAGKMGVVRTSLGCMLSIHLYDDSQEVDVPRLWVDITAPNKFDKVHVPRNKFDKVPRSRNCL